MIKLHLTFLFLLWLAETYSQQYETACILKKADSILISKVGERIFNNYYSYDTNSYYEFQRENGEIDWEQLTKDKITKGTFKEMEVRYKFKLMVFNDRFNMTFVDFDSLLNLKDTLRTMFIPQYVWDNSACNFISKHQALKIAKPNFKEPIVEPLSKCVSFEYSFEKEKYIWSVDNYFKMDEVETIEIDALSSDIITHEKYFFVRARK